MKPTKIYISLASALLLTACANDDSPTIDNTPAVTSEYVLIGAATGAASIDWEYPRGGRATGDDLEAQLPETIGVWGINTANDRSVNSGVIFDNQPMYNCKVESTTPSMTEKQDWKDKKNNDWYYTPTKEWIPSSPNPIYYKFLAYAPYSAEAEVNTPISFDGLQTLTLKNVPRSGADDILVSNVIKQYTSQNNTEQEVQLMYMKHVMSRLRFQFRLGDRYSELRILHLKQLQVENTDGYLYNITIDYPNNELGTITWTLADTQTTPVMAAVKPEFDGDDYIELSKAKNEYQVFGSAYVYPGLPLTTLKLTVTYDVFDLEGQLLRKDDTATNTLWLGFSQSGTVGADITRILEPGYYYDILVPIEPSYLYVLSDNDVTDYMVLPE